VRRNGSSSDDLAADLLSLKAGVSKSSCDCDNEGPYRSPSDTGKMTKKVQWRKCRVPGCRKRLRPKAFGRPPLYCSTQCKRRVEYERRRWDREERWRQIFGPLLGGEFFSDRLHGWARNAAAGRRPRP
jgi:hypothetical protein